MVWHVPFSYDVVILTTFQVFDPMLKRVSYKRQKRWWNAYMLFYTRKDTIENSSLETSMKNMTLK